MTELAPRGLELGNGAPASLDDQTIARFTHSARLPQHARVGLAADLALQLDAHFIGCTVQRLREIRSRHQDMIDKAAADLLSDEGFRRDLADLPFGRRARITVTGDSITADSLSWAHLLTAVLLQTRRDVVILNVAVSGITTGELIAMSDLIVRSRPDWVLQMIGTNDPRRHGRTTQVKAVTEAESRRNYAALNDLVRREAQAQLAVITPPPMDQSMFDSFNPPDADVSWQAQDLEATAQLARHAGAEVTIDLHGQLAAEVTPTFWTDDGVHPSLEGHELIVRKVVQALARLPHDGGRPAVHP